MSFADAVHEHVNWIRVEHGLPQLTRHPLLEIAAQAHAEDMAEYGYHSHTDREGRSVANRVRRTGYYENSIQWSVAENLAAGYTNPHSVVEGWMNSAGHRRNILSERSSDIGVGIQVSRDGMFYWVQVFGSRVVR